MNVISTVRLLVYDAPHLALEWAMATQNAIAIEYALHHFRLTNAPPTPRVIIGQIFGYGGQIIVSPYF